VPPWANSKKRIPEFSHHQVPCPVHTEAKADKQGGCMECKKQYKRLWRQKFGIPPSHEFASDRACARRRGLAWELTFEQWLAVIGHPCVYGYWQGEPGILRIGIDRRDNNEGYTMANSQPCCCRHNRFKSDILTHDEMMDAVQRYGIECGDAPRVARAR